MKTREARIGMSSILFAAALLLTIAFGCGSDEVLNQSDECPDPDDPEVHYIDGSHENTEVCWGALFTCPDGQDWIPHQCGCGCLGPDEPISLSGCDPEEPVESCPDGYTCNECATSSCPECDDCIIGCVQIPTK